MNCGGFIFQTTEHWCEKADAVLPVKCFCNNQMHPAASPASARHQRRRDAGEVAGSKKMIFLQKY
jgi:hypothetical protein